MEEAAVANGGAAPDIAPPAKKDNTKKEEAAESKDVSVANKNSEEQNKGSENGTKVPSEGDVKMAEAEDAREGDAGGAKQTGTEDVKVGGVEDADAKEYNNAKAAEGKDVKIAEAEAENAEVSESDKKVEESKVETPKNKKARSARDRSQGKDKKQDGSKSREAKSLLNIPSPYSTDRPQRERKTVERLVEVIEKETNRNFVVEKGRGTPLKDIPSVAHRISRKKPADLKFLHNILFGRKGKTVDFKGHILQFSGFVWHESDEKQRAKAKEKLDKCVKDMLLDLCWLLAIPVPKTNVRKEDIVVKLLDFIAEPHAITDSGGSDGQGSNSRKRKRGGGSASKTPDGTPKRSKKKFGDDVTPSKRQKKALEYDSDEDEEDEDQPMRSDSEEDKDEDADEAADEQEDDYDYAKGKVSKKSSEVKDSAGKKKAATGSTHKKGPLRTTSKSPGKISKGKESPDDSAKVFSRKTKPVTLKHTPSSEKEIKEKKSSGKKVTKGKGESAEAGLPSKDELRKTIIEILTRVDFNMATFSDILKKLDDHYKIDLTPRKAAIKLMIQEELTKLSEEADEDEDGNEDAEKKQPQRQAKEFVV